MVHSLEERGSFPLSLMVVVEAEAEALMALLLALLVLVLMKTLWEACKFIKINQTIFILFIFGLTSMPR